MKFKSILFQLFLFSFFTYAQQDSIPPLNQDVKTLQSKDITGSSAPVIFRSDTLLVLKNGLGNLSVNDRAVKVTEKLKRFSNRYNASQDSVYLVKKEGYYELMINEEKAFVITQEDAKAEKIPLAMYADVVFEKFEEILVKVDVLTPREWIHRIGYFTLSFIALLIFIKLLNWLFIKLDKRLSKIEKSFLKKNRNILKYFIPKDTVNIFVFLSKIVRIGILVLVLMMYSPFMFSFFPWAEKIVDLFYGYISSPVKYVFNSFVDFIPSLFFIVVIIMIARYIVRVGKDIAIDVEEGKFKLPNFHKDWAQPTVKIFSILVYAISLVVIFPHLPGSGSSAFQGVSIFIGAIISFGSTSAIANIIAGIVITYMRPFQLGDRVKIDGMIGDVIDKTILVTHLRTLKNEAVTIPNANILVGNITNYSKNKDKNILLYTTITLGYDLPWQTAEKLLLKAAGNVKFALKDPPPFVLQKSLDDYYVSYELNISTNKPKKMPLIYSEIHKNILEVFNEAGVEILSPAYMSARDGSLTTVPSLIKKEDKGVLEKLTDHLTGRNQKVTISKPKDSKGD